jgi:hypothetical protein
LGFHQSFWLTGLLVGIQLSTDFDVASNVQNTEVIISRNLSKNWGDVQRNSGRQCVLIIKVEPILLDIH